MNNQIPLRMAIVGTSKISASTAKAADAIGDLRVDAVYSRDRSRATEFAATIGAPWGTDSLHEVLDSPHIDAIYIASPNSVHAAQIALSIDAGKHVLVEKPAVRTASEWQELVNRLHQNSVVLMEAMRTAYDPGTHLVKTLLSELGVLRTASLRYQKRSSRYDQVLIGERVNMFDPEFGGGALADLGVYCLHAMLTLFGSPDRIRASAVQLASGVDGAGCVSAEYEGMLVDLAYSKITTSRLASEIQGELGTMTIDQIASPRLIEVARLNGTTSLHRVDTEVHPLNGELRHFLQLVRADADPSADQLLTGQVLKLMDRVRLAIPC